MHIVAITTTGKEFFYNGRTAHKVPRTKADKIADALNAARYGLKYGQAWHVYEIDIYDAAIEYAVCQSFSTTKGGGIVRKRHAFPATYGELKKRVCGA